MGTLYLCVNDHWEINPSTGVVWNQDSDFGGDTDFSYASMTQTELKIRAARTYPGSGLADEGNAGQLAWYSVGDPNPATWRFGYDGNLSAPLLTLPDPSQDPVVQAWYTAAVAGVVAKLADNPITTGRLIEIDDETMHLWEWGRRGQGGTGHLRRSTLELMQLHEDVFLPIKNGLVDALKAQFTGDSFGWYNVPFTKNKQPPYGGSWWNDSDSPPDLSDTIDTLQDPLLSHADYIDGHLYLNSTGAPPMQTRDRRMGWMRGQIQRKRAVADRLGKPIIFRYWMFRSPDTIYPDGQREIDFIREFFQVCAEEGVDRAGIGGSIRQLANYAASRGKTPGQYWQDTFVESAALAGFLDATMAVDPLPDPVPLDIPEPEPEPVPNNTRPRPIGTCSRNLRPISCKTTPPGGITAPSDVDPVARLLHLLWIGVPSVTGRQQPLGSSLGRSVSTQPPTPGTLQPPDPSNPIKGTLGTADPGSPRSGTLGPADPGSPGSLGPADPGTPGDPGGVFGPFDPGTPSGTGSLSRAGSVGLNSTMAGASFGTAFVGLATNF